ncbi:hypothetical protein ACFLV1_01280, partial [Chloroflexota bacterium]
ADILVLFYFDTFVFFFFHFALPPYPDLIGQFIVTKVLIGINSDPQTIQCIKYFYASVDKLPNVRAVIVQLSV